MLARLKSLYVEHRDKLRPLFRLLVWLPVRFDIWLSQQKFSLSTAGRPGFARPSVLGAPFAYLAYAWRALRALWRDAYAETVLETYSRRNLAHYAPGGIAYSNLESISAQDAAAGFAALGSRLALHLDAYPSLVDYRDGESVLDAGCGKGQNLKCILERFPNSPYTGFDFDPRGLQVAQAGVAGAPHRRLMQGNLLDPAFLRAFADKSVDHALVSHVFSALFESGLAATRASHARIVDELVRISRRSVLILDRMTLDGSVAVEIEHASRATVCETIIGYFAAHRASGEACVLACDGSTAVYFRHRRA